MFIPNENPSRVYINEQLTPLKLSALKTFLTYTDKKVLFQLQKFKKSFWYENKHGPEAFQEEIQRLQESSKVCILFEENGMYWTYSGLAKQISEKFNLPLQNQVVYPEPALLPWDKVPQRKLYEHQELAKQKLLEIKHGAVQLATGTGKSYIILHVIKELGLKTVVMAPSQSIAEQLYVDFSEAFGGKVVGRYYDGKKVANKLITVATAQSLTRLKEGDKNWEELQLCKVFIADESHQCPASTLASVCFGLMAKVPYRFFFSATQMRGDGLDLLLDAITGQIVLEMDVKTGVDKGVLAKPIFRMFKVEPATHNMYQDPNEMTREHLFYNPNVAKLIGNLSNNAVQAGMPVLILIDEVEQFSKILPHLRHEVAFAHGTLNEDNRGKVPKEFWESDPNKLVADFNNNKVPILVGTSCISTGTDVRSVKFLIFWQGGKSEVQVKQAIGRGTRKTPEKDFCYVVDFIVNDIWTYEDSEGNEMLYNGPVNKHAKLRKKIYNSIYGPVHESVV